MTVKNFKGIDEHGITIDFAPITMLFGPNNAGKSTILQAMLLAREVLCHNSADTNTVHGGGDSISLGSFADYVHKHEEWREVSLRFDMEIDELPDYFDYYENGWDNNIRREAEFLLASIDTVGVELVISEGVFDEYIIYINGYKFTAIFIDSAIKKCFFEGCNPYVFLEEGAEEEFQEKIQEAIELHEINNEDSTIVDVVDTLFNNISLLLAPMTSIPQFVLQNTTLITSNSSWIVPLLDDKGELEMPFDGKLPFNFDINLELETDLLSRSEEQEKLDKDMFQLATLREQLLSSLILGPGKLLKEELEKILYIGPLREVPQRNFIPEKVENVEGWAEGYAAWDKIATGDEEEIRKINSWFHGEGSLNIRYKIVRKKILEIEEQNPLISALGELLVNDFDDKKIPLLRRFIEESPRKTKWALVNVNNDVEVHPCDMGTGISQVMPVIVASALAKSGDIISMEQPELHIHPRWQVALGDLFIKAVNAHETPPLFLIETHSEHLLLRFLRRIRETSSKEIPSEDLNFYKENILVNYIFTKNNITTVKKLSITESGDFSERWPHGFFMEREEEIF